MSDTARSVNPLGALECEILQGLARGHSIEQIAQELGINRSVVWSELHRLQTTLRACTYLEAILSAVRQGWIQLPDPSHG